MTGGAPARAPTPVWHMLRAMVGVGLVCGLLIVSVFQWTRPVIARKRAEALQRAIFEVLPGSRSTDTFRIGGGGAFERAPSSGSGGTGSEHVFAGYDETGQLVGVAVETSGMGYQDVIRVLYGYSFDQQALVGIRVLESRETPGLGDRIETDPDFLRNFERLDVSVSEDGAALLHPIEAVKHGSKEHPWQVDGITGATISSVAIADMLQRSTATWIPTLRGRRDDFRRRE